MRTLSGDKLGVNQGTCCIWYRYMVGFYVFDDPERRMCEPVKSVFKTAQRVGGMVMVRLLQEDELQKDERMRIHRHRCIYTSRQVVNQ